MGKVRWKTLVYMGVKYSKYLIYKDGQIYSKKGNRFLEGKKNHKGYKQVTIVTEEGQREVRVHVAVMENFVGSRPEGLTIDHIDGNKDNNHVSNLEYVTNAENRRRAQEMGLYDIHKKKIRGVNVATGEEKEWESIREVAREIYGDVKKEYKISKSIKNSKECCGYILEEVQDALNERSVLLGRSEEGTLPDGQKGSRG